MSCQNCGSTKNLQIHHNSYDPPTIRILCVNCHTTFHHHGVGVSKKQFELGGKTLQTRVTQKISDIVDRIAGEQGLKPSEYIRNLIIQDIDHRNIITTAVKIGINGGLQ